MEARAGYVGARVMRVEDPSFLVGNARYTDDVTLPGMAYAAFVRSPLAHARIRGIDAEAAKALPGVFAVLTAADVADLGPLRYWSRREELLDTERRVLPSDRARHVGDAVAVVVAATRYLAEDACELVEVDWEPLPAVLDAEEALRPDAPVLDEALGGNNAARVVDSRGDVDAVFANAHRVFKKTFRNGRSAAMPLETRGVVADYDRVRGTMTVWTSNQMPHLTRTILAPILGIPEGRLRVIAPAVGGGFGLKAHVFPEDVLVPAAARLVGRPVKWIEDRRENLMASAHSKEVTCHVELAVAEDGTFLGMRGRFVGDAGAYANTPFGAIIDAICCGPTLPSIYKVEAAAYEVDCVLTNKCQTGAYRGVGWTPGQTARETLIDDAARGLGIDPVELRLKNCIPSEPCTTIFDLQYDGGSYAESIRLASEMLDYDGLRLRQKELREQGRYLGVGFSPYVEPTGFGSQISAASGFPVEYFDSASVTVEPDGSVVVTTGLQSQGQGHDTVFAQLAADQLGVRLDEVRVVQGDTANATYGMGTYASRSAVIGGGSVKRAARDVRAKLLRLAAAMLEASPDDIDIRDGNAFVAGSPQVSISVRDLALYAYFGGKMRPADMDEPALTATRSYDPPETYSNGTVAALVEVDPRTGTVDLQRIIAVEDCGTMLNPMIVEGQVAGAIAQGVGGALLEEIVYDDEGQILSSSLMDYLCPSSTDIPPMEIGHIETPSAVTELGIKGMGEAGSIAAPAAILNAIADALSPFGVVIDTVPLTSARILEVIRHARHGD